MLNLKKTKLINRTISINLLQNKFNYQGKNFGLLNSNALSNNIISDNYSLENLKFNKIFMHQINNLSKRNLRICNFSTVSNMINSNNTYNKNIELSNQNIFFLKKLNNFRNNGVVYTLHNTECIFQTLWSNFAYVSLINNNKTYENNLEKSSIDFISTDDNSYTIFQDESSFVDLEDKDEINNFKYKIANEDSSTLQNFELSNEKNKNGKNQDNYTLVTRIPQEFNINLKTNKSVKIVNMGDSKLLGDKEIKIHFVNYDTFTGFDKTGLTNKLNEDQIHEVNLELKRVRSNNINFCAEKNFKVKLTARSYIEGENLNIDIPRESVFRVKKIGVANKGKINLNKSEIDIRSVFSPTNENSDLNNENSICNNLNVNSNLNENKNYKYLEFIGKNSNINIGSLHGNNFINTEECNIIIDNVDCENLIFKSLDCRKMEMFIHSLEKLDQNNFFYFNFFEKKIDKNNQTYETHPNSRIEKDKIIYINQENKKDILILNIDSNRLSSIPRIFNEDDVSDSNFHNNIFRLIYGESNLLSLLVENNKNFYDVEEIQKDFISFLKDNQKNIVNLLIDLRENSLFSNLNLLQRNSEEIIILLNYYLLNILLKDIENSYKIVFIDCKNIEKFDIKEMLAWDITKKRIENKINIAHKRNNLTR